MLSVCLPARSHSLPRLRARSQPGESRLCFSRCFLERPPPKVVGSASLTRPLRHSAESQDTQGSHGKGLPSSPWLFLQDSKKSISIWHEDPGAARPLWIPVGAEGFKALPCTARGRFSAETIELSCGCTASCRTLLLTPSLEGFPWEGPG